jgi:hypothetical protein
LAALLPEFIYLIMMVAETEERKATSG